MDLCHHLTHRTKRQPDFREMPSGVGSGTRAGVTEGPVHGATYLKLSLASETPCPSCFQPAQETQDARTECFRNRLERALSDADAPVSVMKLASLWFQLHLGLHQAPGGSRDFLAS